MGTSTVTRSTSVVVPTLTPTLVSAPATVAGPNPSKSPQESLDYFLEVAFGSEYGRSTREIRKWSIDPRINVHGTPTPEDLATLTEVVADLNALIDTVTLDVVESGGNVDVYFAPESGFAEIEPNYVPGNSGYFWAWWDAGGQITSSRVLVASDVTQVARNHLIREEITQMLGLMNDSFSYPDSIFYGDPSAIESYADLDEYVIRELYRPDVHAGLGVDETLAIIGN
ncbi:DUF2927 domain-containing protein [Mycolicibacterium sp. XJ652]